MSSEIQSKMNESPAKKDSCRTLCLTLVVLAQFAFLFGMIGWYALPYYCRNGAEVTVLTQPCDPRDLLRGDYVILSYEFSRLSDSLTPNRSQFQTWRQQQRSTEMLRGRSVFTVLVQEPGSRFWKMESQTFQQPAEKNQPGAKRIFLRGTVQRWRTVSCGIEQFFVQEGTGRELERVTQRWRAINGKTLAVTLRVTPNGRATVKSVEIVNAPTP